MNAIKCIFLIDYKKTEYNVLLVADGSSYVKTNNGYQFISKYNCPSMSARRAMLTLKNYLKTIL